ncbi:hypothetical protein FCV25MIE_03279 [Fagus crenata]
MNLPIPGHGTQKFSSSRYYRLGYKLLIYMALFTSCSIVAFDSITVVGLSIKMLLLKRVCMTMAMRVLAWASMAWTCVITLMFLVYIFRIGRYQGKAKASSSEAVQL